MLACSLLSLTTVFVLEFVARDFFGTRHFIRSLIFMEKCSALTRDIFFNPNLWMKKFWTKLAISLTKINKISWFDSVSFTGQTFFPKVTSFPSREVPSINEIIATLFSVHEDKEFLLQGKRGLWTVKLNYSKKSSVASNATVADPQIIADLSEYLLTPALWAAFPTNFAMPISRN